MNQHRNRRATISLALIGCVCCIPAGCGQAPGNEYRTYAETVVGLDLPDLQEEQTSPTQSQPVDPVAPNEQTSGASSQPAPGEPEREPVELAALEPGRVGAPSIEASEIGEVAAIVPREIRLLVPENQFQTVGPEEAVRVSCDDLDLLKILNMDPVPVNAPDHFPQWLNALDGQRIRIRGFMMPPSAAKGLGGFVMARDNELCCFGRLPTAYDVFPVQLRGKMTTDYIAQRPFDVAGRFNIYVHMFAGQVEYVYYIDDAIVIDE